MSLLSLISGLAAAGLSWLINGKLLIRFGNQAVIFIGPAVEEFAKTGLAVLLAVPIVITHTLFGITEALWELINSRRGVRAAFYAVATHLFYGVITAIIFRCIGVLPAVALAYLTHMLWNYWVIHKTVSP